MWRVQQEITSNQRAWNRQKYSPTMCKYGCGTNLVFMKDGGNRTIPCESRKIIVDKNDDRRIMEESGLITTMGRRFGWPVHDCITKKVVKDEKELEMPLPELMPIEEND